MATINRFGDLEIWELSRLLSKEIFDLVKTNKLSKEETFYTLYEKTNAVYKKINGFIKYLNTSMVKGTKFKDRLPK